MAGFRKHVAICPHCRRIVEALPLTYQQRRVAQGLIDGVSTRDLARELFVSIKTVEEHRRKIFKTLNVPNVPRLIRWARAQGLLDLMWGK